MPSQRFTEGKLHNNIKQKGFSKHFWVLVLNFLILVVPEKAAEFFHFEKLYFPDHWRT